MSLFRSLCRALCSKKLKLKYKQQRITLLRKRRITTSRALFKSAKYNRNDHLCRKNKLISSTNNKNKNILKNETKPNRPSQKRRTDLNKSNNILFGLPQVTRQNVLHLNNHQYVQNRFYCPSDPDADADADADPDAEAYIVHSHDDTQDIQQAADVRFELIFNDLIEEMGGEHNMIFPNDIMWLSGAPGSGKGEMSAFIREQRGYTSKAINTSELITDAEHAKAKAEGKLVSDRVVVRLLLRTLLEPQYKTGVLVDGFPRTKLQAESVKLLFDKMLSLRRKFEGTDHYYNFRRPRFQVTVLYVGRDLSVQRQLTRGAVQQEDNKRIIRTGVGNALPIRETDLSDEKANYRYQYFLDHVYASLQVIKEKFPFHFINAEATIDVVKQRIIKEIQYQSNSELGDETYEIIRQIPLATEIKKEARQQLVARLDSYTAGPNRELFLAMVKVFKTEYEPIIMQQALAGVATVNSQNPLFRNPIALTMLLDIMAERGYKTVVDLVREMRPLRINLDTGAIEYEPLKVYKFHINFPPPKIRSAFHSYESETTVL